MNCVRRITIEVATLSLKLTEEVFWRLHQIWTVSDGHDGRRVHVHHAHGQCGQFVSGALFGYMVYIVYMVI